MALYLGSNKRAKVSLKMASPITNVSDSEELTSLLVAENLGNVYRYTGETNDTYTNGDLYEVVEL